MSFSSNTKRDILQEIMGFITGLLPSVLMAVLMALVPIIIRRKFQGIQIPSSAGIESLT